MLRGSYCMKYATISRASRFPTVWRRVATLHPPKRASPSPAGGSKGPGDEGGDRATGTSRLVIAAATITTYGTAVPCYGLLAIDQPLVVIMIANPKPNYRFPVLNSKSAVSNSNSHRTVGSDLLKMQRGMIWVCLKKLEILIG
jgi:hypothetical protein